MVMKPARHSAEYFDSHKDDPDEWEEQPAKVQVRPTTVVFSVRFAPAELEVVRRYARENNARPSAVIRKAVLEFLRGGGKPQPEIGLHITFPEGQTVSTFQGDALGSAPSSKVVVESESAPLFSA